VDTRSTHGAQSARIGESFASTEEVDLELIVNRYGVGVDCHSRFFQVCALARSGESVLKYKDKCVAACSDLQECKARVDIRAYVTAGPGPMFQVTMRGGGARDGEEEFQGWHGFCRAGRRAVAVVTSK
jgi:hypothetical protein